MPNIFSFIVASFLVTFFSQSAAAYSSYLGRIPNAPNSCNTCHTNGGGSSRNAFGLAFDANGKSWDSSLANADSDGDGQSNGEELGDPCGTWSTNQTPGRNTGLSNPGDASSLSPDPQAGSLLWYHDGDDDNWGDDSDTTNSCTQPTNHVSVGGDCNDSDPSLLSITNDLDCDGLLNDADSDADGDGTSADSDCDDLNALSTTVAADLDCDGLLNDADPDADGDGTSADLDCDDLDPSSETTATDLDCDGLLNDADSDADGDGTNADSDCDDLDPSSETTTTDLDCDGLLNDADSDADGDGSNSDSDCDDANPDAQVRLTCGDLVESCGVHNDGCGGVLACGLCDDPLDAGSEEDAGAVACDACSIHSDGGYFWRADSGSVIGIDSGAFTVTDGGPTNDDAGSFRLDAGNSPVRDGGANGLDGVSIDAQISITSPEPGEEVGGPWVTVEFSVTGCQIASPNQNPEGCHLSKTLDGTGYTDPGGGGERHYTPTPIQFFVEGGGAHTFRLVLMRNDGSDEAYVPTVSAEVTFNLPTAAPSDPSGGDGLDNDADVEPYDAPSRTGTSGSSCACLAADSKTSNGTSGGVLALCLFVAWRRHRKRH